MEMSECIDHGRSRSLSPEGYALVAKPGVNSRCVRLHRLVLAEKLGVPLKALDGVVVRHTCDNPRCINPEHLIPGTPADNNKDRAVRGRSAKRVPSRQRLTLKDCEDICAKHIPRVYGVTHLAREYGVDANVIYKVLRGEYPCQQPV
jgi:hypothetical protein